MRQALEMALEALDLSNPRFGIGTAKHISATAALRQAIAEAEKQEPDKYVMDIECTKCGAQQSGILTVNTTSQQRKPLTDEELEEIVKRGAENKPFHHWFARAIEAAHGIKE